MNWLKNWIYGNQSPPPKKDPQARYALDSLAFAKQHSKDLRYKQNDTPDKQATTSKQDPQSRYLRDTFTFAKQQHNELRHKQNEHERWQQRYGMLHVDELKKLSGTEFEDYLAELFRSHGYQIETTPVTGDYGADLILDKDRQRIAAGQMLCRQCRRKRRARSVIRHGLLSMS
jgi:hypothetical protein